MNGWGVFSTLRVTDGVLFAYERHYARMQYDAQRMRVPFTVQREDLQQRLLKLVDANQAPAATLRVALVRNKGGMYEAPEQVRDVETIAFTADLAAWGAGVHLQYIANGRFGACPFAGAKITSWAQNLTWNEQAHADGYDEVVLLNEHGEVSECTSANIFGVWGQQVATPPLASAGCLPGVTRALLLEEIQVPGFTFEERRITPAELATADCVFITSTTRDLLPVLTLDRQPVRQNVAVIQKLAEAFRQYRSAYVLSHSRKKEMLAV